MMESSRPGWNEHKNVGYVVSEVFDTEGFNHGFLEDGDYEGLVTGITFVKNQDRGYSVSINYAVVNHAGGDLNGTPVVTRYSIITPTGAATPGLERLKRDITTLGVEKHALNQIGSKVEFVELLDHLAERQVWIKFRVQTVEGILNAIPLSLMKKQEYKPHLLPPDPVYQEELTVPHASLG